MTRELIAVCQHPDGDNLHWHVDMPPDRCVCSGCECTPLLYVAVESVRSMLEATYHPQMGENPMHPADVLDMWVDPCGELAEDWPCVLVKGHAGPHAEAIRAPSR